MRICPLINGECKKRDCEFWHWDYNECVMKFIPRLKEIDETIKNLKSYGVRLKK